MNIDCISDLHGALPELPGGDLLIIAGDLTASDMEHQYNKFEKWLDGQDYRKKIFIAGNHDGIIYESYQGLKQIPFPLHHKTKQYDYLCDSGIDWMGLKIWGSPWTPKFCGFQFMLERGDPLKAKWDLIPDDTDILITHGPPYGIRDCVKIRKHVQNMGCVDLLKAINPKRLKLHVFGHIHEGYGMWDLRNKEGHEDSPFSTIFVNACHMNQKYEPVNPPIRIIL